MITSAQANQNHRESGKRGLDPSKWNFKMYNIKEFKKEFTPYCQGCFRTKDQSPQNSSFKSERGLTFMHCYNCNISSHLYCYGMNTEFYKETLADGEIVNIFLCDRCREDPESESKREACPVCKLTEGGFKKCDDGTWIHLVCALFNDHYYVSNFETLKIHAVPEKDQAERKRVRGPSCDLCGNTGVANMVKCGEGNCDAVSHVYCILKSKVNQKGKKSKSEEGSPGALWQFNLNINDEIIERKQRMKNTSQFYLDPKKITDYADRINKLFDDANFTPQKAKKKRGGRVGKTDTPREEVPLSVRILKKIKSNGTHIFNPEGEHVEGLNPNGLVELKNTLSKRIFVRCAKHNSPLKLCKCDTPPAPSTEPDIDWIACDFCDNWYHYDCVGLDKTAAQQIESYFCPRCLEWAQIKMNCFEELETIVKSRNGFPTTAYQFKKFIPSQSRFMHICDLICSGVLMEILIEKALTSSITYEEIRELIQDTFILPLDFTESIRKLCIKAYKGMVLEECVEFKNVFADVKFETLLLPSGGIKEGEFEAHKATLQLYERILNIYHTECHVNSDILSRGENITAILRWQLRVVEILQTKTSHKINFDELQTLYSEFDGIASSYIAMNSEEKNEEEDQMLIESSELNELAANEKEQLNQLINSCQEWIGEYHGLLKKSVEHMERFCMNIENEQNMNIEDEVVGRENDNGEVVLSQVAEENVQKIINRYLEYQTNKIKVQDFDGLLAKMDKYAVEFAPEKRVILAAKARYSECREQILKLDTNHMTPEQLEHMIEENDNEILYIPEMKRLYDLLKDFKIFSTKCQFIISRIEVTKKYYSQASKGDLLKDEKPMNVSLDEIQSLIQEAYQLPLDLSMYILSLQERVNEANKLKDFLMKFVQQPVETESLIALKIQALQSGVLTPEIMLINDKIKVSEEIKERIQIEMTSEELENQISLAERKFLDPSILKDLKLKSQKVDQVRQHCYIFMCKREFSENDLNKVYQLLEGISKLRVNFEEKEFLMGIIKSFSWFFELLNLLSTISRPDYSGREEETPQIFKNFDVSKIFKLNIGEDIAFCTQETTKETLLQYSENIFEKFQKLMQFGSKQTFSDHRLLELYNLYARMLWFLEVRRLRNSTLPISPGTLIRLHKQAQQVDKLNEDCQWLNNTFNKYNNWIQVVADKIYLVSLDVLCEESQIQENYNIVQQALNTYPSLNIEADFIYKAVCKANATMEWQFKAENCYNLIENMNKVTYESVKNLNEWASERNLNLPESLKYVQMISTLEQNATQLLEENLELLQILRNYESSQEVKAVQGPENFFCVDVETGLFKVDFYRKSTGDSEKYPYQKAFKIANQLTNSPISFEKDFESIKVHLDRYEAWYTRVGEIKRKYKLDEFLLSPDEFPVQTYTRNSQIINEIDGLKIELTNLIFFDEEKENELFIIEWSLAALFLITKQGLLTLIPSSIKPSGAGIIKAFNENNFVIWESLEECLRRYEDKLTPELSQQVHRSYLYRILTEQIIKTRGILEKIKDMKTQEIILTNEVKRMNVKELCNDYNRDHLKSLSEIKQISREIEEEVLININREKTQLNEIVKRYDELMKQYENLEFQPGAAKIGLLNAENLFKDLLILPVKYSQNEDKNLQKGFKEYQELEEDLDQVRKNQKDNTVVGYVVAMGISEKYRKCLIQNAEAEKIQKDLEKGEILLKKVETLDQKVPFDEAIKYYEQICSLKVDFGVRAEKKRSELWMKVVDFIKNKEVPGKGARPITFDVLKEILSDAYRVYQGEATEEMMDIVVMMEDLVRRAEDKIQEIFDQTDVKALGKMDTTIGGGLVSVKGELQSHSQKLAQNSSYQSPKLVSMVKNPLKTTTESKPPASASKGKPGRRPNPSKMKQTMEVEKVAPAPLRRTESDDMTVSEPVVGKRSRKKSSREEEELEQEENIEEKKKLLKTEKGGQEAQIRKEEVKQKVREKNVNQLLQLLEQNNNKLIGLLFEGKDQLYRKGASKVEEYTYQKFSDSASQYNTHIKNYLAVFSKLKNFEYTFWCFCKEGFTEEAINYLFNNLNDLKVIESGISLLPNKSLAAYMEQEKDNEQQENLKELIATNARVANTAESGPIKANPIIEIPSLNLKPEVAHQIMQVEEKKTDLVKKSPVPEKIQRMLAKLSAKKENSMTQVDKENQVRPNKIEGLGVIQKVSSKEPGEPDLRREIYQQNRNIYKIFEGEFFFTLMDRETKLQVNLLSMAHPDEYLELPKIPKTKVQAKAKLDLEELKTYFDRIIINPASDLNVKLIACWFQMRDGESNMLEEIANQSKQSGKAFRCKYSIPSSDCTLYAFHIDDFKPRWCKKITFNKDYLSTTLPKEFKPSSLMVVIKIRNYIPTDEEPHVEAQPVFEFINHPEQPTEKIVENKKEAAVDEMEIEKAKDESSENIAGLQGIEEEVKGESEQKEQEINFEVPEIITGEVTSHQDTSFVGIESQGRPKLVETGDMAVHEEKKDMEVEGGESHEIRNNHEYVPAMGNQEVENFFM